MATRRQKNHHIVANAETLSAMLPAKTVVSPLQVMLNDMGEILAAEFKYMRKDAADGVRLTNEGAQKLKHMATAAVSAQEMTRRMHEDGDLANQSAADLARAVLADPETREHARKLLAAEMGEDGE